VYPRLQQVGKSAKVALAPSTNDPEERDWLLKLAPGLNVAIISPTARPADVRAKVQACLRNGIQLLWIVEPRRQQVLVHRPERPPTF